MPINARRMIDGGSARRPVSTPAPKPVSTPKPSTGTAAAVWSGISSMGQPVAQTKPTVQPPQPKPSYPPAVNQARTELFTRVSSRYIANAYSQNALYRHLPPEDQQEMRAGLVAEAQRRGNDAVARFDQVFEQKRQAFANRPIPDGMSRDDMALNATKRQLSALFDPAASYINQRDGYPPLPHNENCGFASGVAVMRYLGTQVPFGATDYDQVNALRQLGLPGTDGTTGSRGIELANTLKLAGVNATWTDVSLDPAKVHAAVEDMKNKLLESSGGSEAFIVGGVPKHAWGEFSTYYGPHWASVVDYDPATNMFTVLDSYPYPNNGQHGQPIQVSPQQLETYMTTDHVNQGYVEVRP